MSITFSGTTPAAPAGNMNITFQADGHGHVSGYVPTPGSTGAGGSNGNIQYNNGGALGGSASTITAAGTIEIPSGQVLGWNSDSGISRLGPASLALGNGTTGDYTGILKLKAINIANGTDVAFIGSTSASSGYSGLWLGTLSPTFSNYSILGSTGSTQVYFNALNDLYFQQNTNNLAYMNSSRLALSSGVVLGWSSSATNPKVASDTGLSRDSAGVLDFGNGTAGDTSGNLRFNRINLGGTDLAGQATITTGNTTKAISFVANYTSTGQPVICITPTSDPLVAGVPVGYWVTYNGSAGAWTGFTINIQTALAGNVTFNYVVIGQV